MKIYIIQFNNFPINLLFFPHPGATHAEELCAPEQSVCEHGVLWQNSASLPRPERHEG